MTWLDWFVVGEAIFALLACGLIWLYATSPIEML